MRKFYSEPEVEIKQYALAQGSYITTSDLNEKNPDGNDKDLEDKDTYPDYFG